MARKRQLELTGLAPAKSEPVFRAKRDLNAWEFARALARHGLSLRGVDHYVDAAGTALIVHPVTRRDPLRVVRRATPAKVVKLQRVLAERGQNRHSESQAGAQNRGLK